MCILVLLIEALRIVESVTFTEFLQLHNHTYNSETIYGVGMDFSVEIMHEALFKVSFLHTI
jgi:hypothetical protein